jgi:hypothetical protein
MGYDAAVGYAVGAIFDLAKGSLLIGVLAFWARRALLFAAIFALIWVCLVTFSWLATHATVMTAISSIERMGAWRMEVRGNTKAELATIEQQLAALGRPAVPRPANTVREELAATSVPPGVWKDSKECNGIQESAYFAKACAHVVRLRRELVAAQDYERLSARAGELRKGLADAPIVATSDPLPEAFNATLGRVLPMSGKGGVALLLTAVLELMSAFGFAGLRSLANAKLTGTPTLAPCRWRLLRKLLRQRLHDPSLGSSGLPSPKPPCRLSLVKEGGFTPTRSGRNSTLPLIRSLPSPNPPWQLSYLGEGGSRPMRPRRYPTLPRMFSPYGFALPM